MEDLLVRFAWPIMAVVVVVAFFLLVKGIAAFYIKVPPNMAAFFYGARSGKKKMKRALAEQVGAAAVLPPGTVVVTGGGRIRKPVIEAVKFLDLSEITLADLKVDDMPNIDGVLVTVEAVANIKFKDDAQSLLAAGGRFLDKARDEIRNTARETLEANLRGVVGRLTVEQIIQDRDAFRQKVLDEAGEDLQRLGMQIDVFNPQSITDSMHYIEALGKKRTAEVQRDAAIGEAEAASEAKKKSSDADRAAEVVAQENERLKAEAVKTANVAKQQYAAEVATETARAEQAGPLSTAEAKQKVIVAEVKIEEEAAKAQIHVEEQNILREQKAREASIVVPAKAKADALVRESEGYKQAEIARAGGDKQAIIARADAQSHKMEVEGAGEASATKATGLAEADVIERTGLAKAIAVSELAKAYQQFNDAALTLEVLKALPAAIEALGTVFGAIAAPMGNIDKLVVVDSGGNGGKDGALDRFAKTGPTILFNLIEQAGAAGIDVKGLLSKAGIKTDDITNSVASAVEKAASDGGSQG
jgi:flotillin